MSLTNTFYKLVKLSNTILTILIFAISTTSCKRNRTYEDIANENDPLYKKVEEKIVPLKQCVATDSILYVSTPNKKGQILTRIAYLVSYNSETRIPNWVSWRLTKEHTDGPYSRAGVPYYDENGSAFGIGNVSTETIKNGYFMDLDSDEPRQSLSDWSRDYNMSHGHMCPAADNRWDKSAMNQSFLLTNMCPQDEKLNGGAWQKLEEKCRTWANKYGSIYIVAGPIFYSSPSRFLGSIAIPDAFFKVVLCLEGTPRAIGFLYKNDSSRQSMKDCACSVDSIEEATGYDFFYSIPDEIENEIEKASNLSE